MPKFCQNISKHIARTNCRSRVSKRINLQSIDPLQAADIGSFCILLFKEPFSQFVELLNSHLINDIETSLLHILWWGSLRLNFQI